MIEHTPLYERHPAPWRYEASPFFPNRWAVYDARDNIVLITRQEAKAAAVASIPLLQDQIDRLHEIILEAGLNPS